MITFLEEAMNLVDSAESMTKVLFDYYDHEPRVNSVLYGIIHLLETANNLMTMIEEAPDGQPNTSEAKVETQTNSITYHDVMTEQFDTSEGLNEPVEEIPFMQGTSDALENVIESAPKPRLTGKKGKAFRLWKDKGAGPSRIVEECDISLEKAAKWVREFVEMQK